MTSPNSASASAPRADTGDDGRRRTREPDVPRTRRSGTRCGRQPRRDPVRPGTGVDHAVSRAQPDRERHRADRRRIPRHGRRTRRLRRPATGTIALTDWITAHASTLGHQYANELDRHFRPLCPGRPLKVSGSSAVRQRRDPGPTPATRIPARSSGPGSPSRSTTAAARTGRCCWWPRKAGGNFLAVKLTSKGTPTPRLGTHRRRRVGPRARESWANIDRVIQVHASGMRREAAALDGANYQRVEAALRTQYGWR